MPAIDPVRDASSLSHEAAEPHAPGQSEAEQFASSHEGHPGPGPSEGQHYWNAAEANRAESARLVQQSRGGGAPAHSPPQSTNRSPLDGSVRPQDILQHHDMLRNDAEIKAVGLGRELQVPFEQVPLGQATRPQLLQALRLLHSPHDPAPRPSGVSGTSRSSDVPLGSVYSAASAQRSANPLSLPPTTASHSSPWAPSVTSERASAKRRAEQPLANDRSAPSAPRWQGPPGGASSRPASPPQHLFSSSLSDRASSDEEMAEAMRLSREDASNSNPQQQHLSSAGAGSSRLPDPAAAGSSAPHQMPQGPSGSSPEAAAPPRPSTPKELKLQRDERRYDPARDGKIKGSFSKATRPQQNYVFDRLRTSGPDNSARRIGKDVGVYHTTISTFSKKHGVGAVSSAAKYSDADKEDIAMQHLFGNKPATDIVINGQNVFEDTVNQHAAAFLEKYPATELADKKKAFLERNSGS